MADFRTLPLLLGRCKFGHYPNKNDHLSKTVNKQINIRKKNLLIRLSPRKTDAHSVLSAANYTNDLNVHYINDGSRCLNDTKKATHGGSAELFQNLKLYMTILLYTQNHGT